MLKRTAENALWMNRYRVRAEVQSRLLAQHFQNLLDRPRRSVNPDNIGEHIESWEPCLLVAGIETDERTASDTQPNALRMLVSDRQREHSIAAHLRQVHVNLRCCRDFLDQQLFESLNHMCMHGGQVLSINLNSAALIALLHDLNTEMMAINGIIEHRMPHSHVYQFLKLGELLERSEMAIRMIQMCEDECFRESPRLQLVDDNSDSSNSATQQHQPRSAVSRERVRWLAQTTLGASTTDFASGGSNRKELPAPGSVDLNLVNTLIRDRSQPQSLAFCLLQLQTVLDQLDDKQPAAIQCRELTKRVIYIDDVSRSALSRDDLLDLLEDYQSQIGQLHEHIQQRYMRGSDVAEIGDRKQATG